MKHLKDKIRRRLKRKYSIRKKVKGNSLKPRISVFRSNLYCYVQVIDDDKGTTLAAASNLEKENKSIKTNIKSIGQLGEIVGKKMNEKKIKKAVFDRNGRKYHGVIKAIADGIRKAGIEF